MRFSTAIVATLGGIATASPAAPGSGSWFDSLVSGTGNNNNDGGVSALDAGPVPGDNPLVFCDGDHSLDTILIDNVDLAPNPPEAGSELLIKAKGTVLERIEQGAYVQLVVKYGLIRLISTTADFCEQLGNVDLKCPIEKGALEVTKSVEIPKEVPPGTYHVNAQVFNADDKPITCLQATVKFGGRRSSVEEVEL
ncbi:Phosphatidylglycerol/phosphatidylinositol transfer protein [Microdochium nivale]|nr:Phosphatidylglycerol/phosphatidylinositol transfer protein [Microdochium nivale]